MKATLYHNPNCGTSRNVLAALREAGADLTVIDYVKTGWSRDLLQSLFARMGVTPREILRVRGTPAEDLGLTRPSASDDAILEAMVAHPILVERPIVATETAVLLCRPSDRVQTLIG